MRVGCRSRIDGTRLAAPGAACSELARQRSYRIPAGERGERTLAAANDPLTAQRDPAALVAADGSLSRLTLRRPPLLDLGGESRQIESRPGEAGVACSVFDEAIGNADVQHGHLQSGSREQFAHR